MKNSKDTLELIKEAIEKIGGARELARAVGVSYKTVLDWKNGRTGVNIKNAVKIEKATEGVVKARDLLPEYPWEELK